MPRRIGLVALVWLAAGGVARAAEYRYVEPGSQHEFAVISAPLPAEAIGQLAVEALRRARDAKDGITDDDPSAQAAAAPAAPADPAGPDVEEPPPELAWHAAAAAPFGAARGKGKSCDCSTTLGDLKSQKIAAVYLKRTFHVGPERGRVKVLRLRARYQDGMVAYVNGVEVARRNLDRGSAPQAPARRSHGPEWEAFYIAVTPDLVHDGENTLMIEVRPTLTRLAPLIDVELTASEQAQIVRGPIVQRLTETSATIVFETDLPTLGDVSWGTAASEYGHHVDAGGDPTTRHVVDIGPLPRDSEIHYQVATAEEKSADYAFHTAPAEGDPVRFVVYGDVRSGHDTHADILAAIAGEAPDFVIATGDMVLRGSDEADWQRFFTVAGSLLARFPVYPVVGNHDLGKAGDLERRFEDIFALPDPPAGRPDGAVWYSFDVAGVHWVMLDSNRYEDSRQLDWLEQDLAAAHAAGARAIFAATHAGPWSRGPHHGDPVCAAKYTPVLEKYGVAMIFSGHDHLYQRGEMGKLRYVVTGGGGAELYKETCGRHKAGCKDDGAAIVVSEHHYVAVEVWQDKARLCARRADGTLLEECITFPLAP